MSDKVYINEAFPCINMILTWPRRAFKMLIRRHRLLIFLICFSSFMMPIYLQELGWSHGNYEIVRLILSSAIIYQLVKMVWPSLIIHILAYWLVYRLIKTGSREFIAFSGLLYLAIAFGQGTAFTKYGLSLLTSNIALMSAVGLLWLRDFREKVGLKGKGPAWFLPFGLFAFAAPMAGPTPWAWIWESARANPLLALPAFTLDALAGFGAVAYCLFTPLALSSAARAGAIRPLTMRMTSMLGILYSTIIITFFIAGALVGSIPAGEFFKSLWNSVLHIPLLITCAYYFLIDVELYSQQKK